MENQNRSKRKVVVWRFIDGKPGHEKQTAGILHHLKQCLKVEMFSLNCSSGFRNLINILFKDYNAGSKLPKPDILLGAGHATHLEIIAAQKKFGGKSIIIMKPTLPYSMFDLCIIPKHDKPPERKNIIVSEMPLSPADSSRPIDESLGVFLIGGASRHFEWSDQLIIDEIENIVRQSPQLGMKWKLSTSRRTPVSFLAKLRKRNLGNIKLIDFKDCPADWVESHLSICDQAWVTQESYSMICEAVNACRKVGILELERKQSFFSFRKRKFSKLPNLSLTTYSDWCESFVIKPNDAKFQPVASIANQVLAKIDLGR